MYENILRDIENDLDKESLRKLFLMIKDSTEIFNDLVGRESDIFSGKLFCSDIKTRMLNFIITRAFSPNFLPRNFPFDVEILSLQGAYHTPKLKKGNTILTISKVKNKNKLPSRADYKEEYSRGNLHISEQLKFVFDEEYSVEGIPYYGILGYEFSKDKLKGLNIIVPDENFKKVVKTIPIPIIHSVKVTEIEEETILDKDNLKKDILNQIKNLK